MTRDFDLVWDFEKPGETENVFVSMLGKAPDQGYRLELLTQIARCKGLQRGFEEAHSTLNEVESEMGRTKGAFGFGICWSGGGF